MSQRRAKIPAPATTSDRMDTLEELAALAETEGNPSVTYLLVEGLEAMRKAFGDDERYGAWMDKVLEAFNRDTDKDGRPNDVPDMWGRLGDDTKSLPEVAVDVVTRVIASGGFINPDGVLVDENGNIIGRAFDKIDKSKRGRT